MSPPTGPACVGLQLKVLPAEVATDTVDAEARVCWITAPTCRYGSAVYRARMRFALGGSTMWDDGEETVASGTSMACVVDNEYPLLGVELFLVSVRIEPSALCHITSRELAEALQHPRSDIREAVLLALGQ